MEKSRLESHESRELAQYKKNIKCIKVMYKYKLSTKI